MALSFKQINADVMDVGIQNSTTSQSMRHSQTRGDSMTEEEKLAQLGAIKTQCIRNASYGRDQLRLQYSTFGRDLWMPLDML